MAAARQSQPDQSVNDDGPRNAGCATMGMPTTAGIEREGDRDAIFS
jgi:hypothetical protein